MHLHYLARLLVTGVDDNADQEWCLVCSVLFKCMNFLLQNPGHNVVGKTQGNPRPEYRESDRTKSSVFTGRQGIIDGHSQNLENVKNRKL